MLCVCPPPLCLRPPLLPPPSLCLSACLHTIVGQQHIAFKYEGHLHSRRDVNTQEEKDANVFEPAPWHARRKGDDWEEDWDSDDEAMQVGAEYHSGGEQQQHSDSAVLCPLCPYCRALLETFPGDEAYCKHCCTGARESVRARGRALYPAVRCFISGMGSYSQHIHVIVGSRRGSQAALSLFRRADMMRVFTSRTPFQTLISTQRQASGCWRRKGKGRRGDATLLMLSLGPKLQVDPVFTT